ncbi:hypothetical protein GF386_06410 [Candidatus Pacearchaeota archaeon]|nr:hypothetical protein [Candidatus Pacearchaeota archaeon]MBD3283722.1 hypothetical protein [Candidatus Pacearchaeota archaeon]
MKVYIASPGYNRGEREVNEEISSALENGGFETFLEHRDLPGYNDLKAALKTDHESKAREIAVRTMGGLKLVSYLRECQAAVINITGRTPDEGSVLVAGMAYTKCIPMVFYKSGSRTPLGGCESPLIEYLRLGRTVRNIPDIPGKLRDLIEQEKDDLEDVEGLLEVWRERGLEALVQEIKVS